jgi:hypothetical protein
MKPELVLTLHRQGFLTVNEAREYLGYNEIDMRPNAFNYLPNRVESIASAVARHCAYCGGYTRDINCHNCGAPMKASGRPLSVEEVVAMAQPIPDEELTRMVAEDIREQERYVRQ